MNDRPIRALIVENDHSQVQLLEEAFAEMEESRFQRPLFPVCERRYARDAEDAAAVLGQSSFDVVLLGRPAQPAYLRLRHAAPELPIVLLAAAQDEAVALSLVRQGAQDYLLYDEVDCAPLARAIRCAVERQRLWHAAQNVSHVDDLTGFYNERGFRNAAGRLCRLAAEYRLPVNLRFVSTSPASDPDLAAVELAEQLRVQSPETAILGRWSPRTFAILTIAGNDTPTDFDSLLQLAQRLPCENEQIESRPGRYL